MFAFACTSDLNLMVAYHIVTCFVASDFSVNICDIWLVYVGSRHLTSTVQNDFLSPGRNMYKIANSGPLPRSRLVVLFSKGMNTMVLQFFNTYWHTMNTIL